MWFDRLLVSPDMDPSETQNLVVTRGDIANEMLSELIKLNGTVFSPDRGPGEAVASIADAACDAALNKHGGFWGPFIYHD